MGRSARGAPVGTVGVMAVRLLAAGATAKAVEGGIAAEAEVAIAAVSPAADICRATRT